MMLNITITMKNYICIINFQSMMSSDLVKAFGILMSESNISPTSLANLSNYFPMCNNFHTFQVGIVLICTTLRIHWCKSARDYALKGRLGSKTGKSCVILRKACCQLFFFSRVLNGDYKILHGVKDGCLKARVNAHGLCNSNKKTKLSMFRNI